MKIKNKKEIYELINTLIVEYQSTTKIINILKQKYNISERTAYHYLSFVNTMNHEEFENSRSRIAWKNFERLERIMYKEWNKEKVDCNLILKAIDLQNKIAGVYTQKIETEHKYQIADDDPLREMASKIING
ncbi:MAG TPA: hypothetical protein PKZ43_07510 [Bacteroidales bacterium]|nr:hypothetical protein [Bacteroidales bacterium]